MGYAEAANLFVYADANPTTLTDPTGAMSWNPRLDVPLRMKSYVVDLDTFLEGTAADPDAWSWYRSLIEKLDRFVKLGAHESQIAQVENDIGRASERIRTAGKDVIAKRRAPGRKWPACLDGPRSPD